MEIIYKNMKKHRKILFDKDHPFLTPLALGLVQAAILDCHRAAKTLSDPAQAALCHAVGQACATVHTPGHALGFPVHELTAIVLQVGAQACREPVLSRCAQYQDRLLGWMDAEGQINGPWAAFLKRDCR